MSARLVLIIKNQYGVYAARKLLVQVTSSEAMGADNIEWLRTMEQDALLALPLPPPAHPPEGKHGHHLD